MGEMNDLEIVRRCAQAMGINVVEQLGGLRFPNTQYEESVYDPLHDAAQAFALVEKFDVWCMKSRTGWEASISKPGAKFCTSHALHADLKRAICLAVASGGKEG